MILKVILVLIYLHCCLVARAWGRCFLELPENPALRPIFHKTVGSRTAVMSNENVIMEIQDNEEVTAYCDTRFKTPSDRAKERMMKVLCVSNQIRGHYGGVLAMECDSLKWNLYESSAPFKWCPPVMASYILARPSVSSYEYLAGICYNFEEMAILSIYYAVAPTFSKYVYPHRLRNYTPSVEVQNIPISFTTQNFTSSMYDNPQFQEWMKFANYENHSIIQNPKLYHDSYDQFGGLLDFAWWPGLRLGNWRLYEKALGQHIEADSPHAYEILAGVSGTVAAPIHKGNCPATNLTLVELADRTNRKIPLYVWHYLKSTTNDNDNDTYVIIGVNSPFPDFYKEKELVFCNNICEKIDWLQNVHHTFHFKTMGIVFCCTVEEVKASKRLNGFPLRPKLVTPTPRTLSVFHGPPAYDDLDEPVTLKNYEITNELHHFDEY